MGVRVDGRAAPRTAGVTGPTGGGDIAYRRWRTVEQLRAGTLDGAALDGETVVIAGAARTRVHADPYTGATGSYDYATWTSPPVAPGFPATEVTPSWTADTPGGCWLQVQLRGITETGATTPWYDLGRWAEGDGIRRTSVPGQDDAHGSVQTDTFGAATGHGWTSWQLRVTLLRPTGRAETPALRSAGAVASRLPASAPGTVTAPGRPLGVTLDVPRYSQQVHAGHYSQWDGGGKAWCSPAATTMVLHFWGAGPSPAEYAWVDPSDPDPYVDHAARHCFDHGYGGTGNWPFNTAYAGRYGLDAFITRLRSLAEAEQFVAAGIPLIVSASFREGQIDGLDYVSNGHIMVLVGFTVEGDPVLNDPNAATNDGVRKTAPRAEFEAAWLAGSHGLVYVFHPASVALPPPPAQANW